MALDPADLKLVAAYCERNKKIPKLLAKSNDFRDNTDAAADMDTTSSLAPSFFLVARQAPRMSGTTILIGLLGILGGDIIGPPQIVLAMKRSNDSMNAP
jgi:hypothetical protein